MSCCRRPAALSRILHVLLCAQVAASAVAAEPAPPAQTTDEPASWWSLLLRPFAEFGVESWGDAFRLGRWGGSVSLGFDEQRQTVRSADGSVQRFGSRLMNESLTLRNQGFALIDPRLLSGNTTLRFSLQQNRAYTESTSLAQHGLLVDYSFDATLLPEKPYNASVFANRAQSTYSQPSGGTTQVATENRSLVFRLREDSILRDREILPYFSASARILQEQSKELTTVAGQTFRRDDERKVLALAAHNGTETSDLDVQHERTRFTNHTYEAGSYESQSTNVVYSRDFGPTLSRRWDSRINYYSRTGATSISNLAVTESLAIDHHAALSSAYDYQYSRQTTPDGSATVHNAGARLVHRLYANLNTTAAVSAMRQTLPDGTIDSRGAQLNLAYNHRIPWNGQLFAAVGGGYQVTSNQLASGLVPVTDARYVSPPQFGGGAAIVLKDRFIVVDSILVIAIKGGARVPTVAGIDYTVLSDGERTSLLPQLTSAVITPGDALDVSYVYRVDPSVKYQAISRSASVTADWHWLAINFTHDEMNQKPLGGGDVTLLTHTRRDSMRLDLRGDWEALQARGDATVLRYEDNRIAYDEWRLTQQVAYIPMPHLRVNLSANEYRTVYRVPTRETSGNSVRLDVDWLGWNGWLGTAYAARRSFRDTEVPSDTVLEAGLKLRRKWTKLDVALVLGATERTRGGVQSRNLHLNATAIRHF